MKVRQFYNKNQFIITGENKTIFQSYDSTIAEINGDRKLKLFADWDYSHTTLKHLYLFINDFGYLLTRDLRDSLWGLSETKNKRQYIQNLIDKKIIKYEC